MNDKRFSSIPHHMNNQFVLESIISVLIIIVEVTRIRNERFKNRSIKI